MYRRFFLRTIYLLLLLVVVSCSSDGDADDNTKALQGAVDNSVLTEVTATPTATPLPEVSVDTLFAGSSYETLYVHNSTLYHLTGAMNQPEVIETHVHPASLALAPDYSTVIFGIEKSEMDLQSLGILNLTTMEISTIELPSDEIYMPSVVHGWSTDNQWVILSFSPSNDNILVVNLWTGDYTKLDWYNEGEDPVYLSMLWLTDNRLLVHAERHGISQIVEGVDAVTLTDNYIFDPMTGEHSPVELTREALGSLAVRLSPATLNTLDKELQSQGLALAVPQLPLDRTEY